MLGIQTAAAFDNYTSSCDGLSGGQTTCTSPNPGGATLISPVTSGGGVAHPELCSNPNSVGTDTISFTVPAGYSVTGSANISYITTTGRVPATGPLGSYVFTPNPNPIVGPATQSITITYPPVADWQTTFIQGGQNYAEIHVDLHFFVSDSTGQVVGELGPLQDWDVTCVQTTPPPPPPTYQLSSGMTATIGFWHNKNGQALILGLNGGSTAPNLANFLKTNYPNLFGCYSLATNQDVANLFLTFFNQKGQKLQAQILGAALATYVTDASLAGNNAAAYGFKVSQFGSGQATYNVGSNGAAFGVPNNTVLTVSQILAAANNLTPSSANCNPYGGNTSLQNMANNVFDGINSTGDIKS